MIISHKHKLIFLKTSKTAGTSTEIGLARFCGPSDIVTPTDTEGERTRNELNYPGPMNYQFPWYEKKPEDLVRWLRGKRERRKYFLHIKARQVRKNIGEEIWNSYYKFCTERNPFERFVSYYFNMHPKEPRPSIDEFMDRGLRELKANGWGVYTADNKVIVDKVCRFENLDEELESVRREIGLPEPIQLPRLKTQYRKDKSHYSHFLTGPQIERIANHFDQEIRMFGYPVS